MIHFVFNYPYFFISNEGNYYIGTSIKEYVLSLITLIALISE